MESIDGRLIVEVPLIDRATDPVQSDSPAADPTALAKEWLPADGEDRMLMTVSTVDAEGFPRGRTVMLSEFDGERFFFHTDSASQKVADLTANPKVSLTILWPGFTRQLVVQGTAEAAPPDEASRAYETRSPYLRQLAWLNDAETAILPRAEREQRWAAYAARVPDPVQPDNWVGYGVSPHRLLFWVSHPDAPSRRVEYTRTAAGWKHRHLPG
ncbi:pyridoxamine 5'-phosphate oxidase family protein [Microbacterium sp.]|uniref:pyridoxine/pyridoxamine 5'-phosphate oxidase n=1 Tax=Microbacterium sp. TaxID=51671 RepID=UPI0025FA7602|nr:pyridoxamine 5'-phosphate oxidase family protein [Microbacterium sp.]